MKGDFTRNTFRRNRHYNAVLMQQGRVQLDADFNEQQAIRQYHDQRAAADVIGASGTPQDDPGFAISVGADSQLRIGAGRYYVDGILVENEAAVSFADQPNLSGVAGLPDALADENAVAGLVYLDVWERLITPHDDPLIREQALGGPDTALRSQVVWQVRVLPLPSVQFSAAERAEVREAARRWRDAGEALLNADESNLTERRREFGAARRALVAELEATGLTCDAPFPERDRLRSLSTGQMNAHTTRSEDDEDNSCLLPPQAGYQGLENQLYRVEIHTGGNRANATFKWSRENGSVVARITNVDGSQVTVDSTGRDPVLGFSNSDWVEITGENSVEAPSPGALHQIDVVDPATGLVTLKSAPDVSGMGDELRIRRWDMTGTAAEVGGGIPLSGEWTPLEKGIKVQFSAGQYRPGDYWLIPARTATGEIEWPPFETPNNAPEAQAPHGVRHHFADLAIVLSGSNNTFLAADCRRLFPPLTDLNAEDIGFDNTACNLPGANTVQAAIEALCQRSGGCVELIAIPGEGWEVVFDQIEEGEDAVICFQPGTYIVRETVEVPGSGHLKIAGAGPGTRVIAPGDERALEFSGWQSVTIRDLYAESRRAAETNDINGVLSFINCRSVTVEHVDLKCGSAPVRAASCLTIRNDSGHSSGTQARVRGCDLAVGYLQVGMLIVNVERPQVEDNTIQAVARPSGLTWDKLIANKNFRARIISNLVRGGSYGVPEAVRERGRLSIGEIVERSAEMPDEVRESVARAIAEVEEAPDENEVRRILSSGDPGRIMEMFAGLPLNSLNNVNRTMSFMMAAGGAAEGPGGAAARRTIRQPRNVMLNIGNAAFAFDTDSGSARDWEAVIRANVPESAGIATSGDLQREVRRLAERILLDPPSVEGGQRIKRYVNRVRQSNPAVMSRGIVVAGRVATDARLVNNTVRGAMQGVRVGLSHSGAGPGSFDQIGRLVIAGNTIMLTVSVVAERERYGVFVGNCYSLLVENNRVNLTRSNTAGKLHVEGIRLYGHYGPSAIVGQNHLSGFNIGVYFNFLNDLKTLGNPLWLIADNLAEGVPSSSVVEIDAQPRSGETEAEHEDRKDEMRKRVRIEGNMP
jgi:hypothetical protein